MIHYLLQTLVFQLIFLLVYDVFLKKETFYSLNRIYLLVTPLLSLLIPFIQFDFIRESVQKSDVIKLQEVVVGVTNKLTETNVDYFTLLNIIEIGGLIALGWFVYKLIKIYQLIRHHKQQKKTGYIEVVLAENEAAFSFFRYIFIGENITESNKEHIIRHELVHIRQKHSFDLIFFECMRILFWFNPLVYVFQQKISELHEFIADEETAKDNRTQQYEFLLQQVFRTEKFSFVNQFFKQSLIKKRITMLNKKHSAGVKRVKFALLVPTIFIMLFYVSCQEKKLTLNEQIESLEQTIQSKDSISIDDYNRLFKLYEAIAVKKGMKDYIGKDEVPFAFIDEVPVFPGCENVSLEERRACFQDKMNEHIRTHFQYPVEAQEKGIQGKVYVQFIINKEGAVEGVRLRGPDKQLEDEVRRMVSLLPQMKPGKQQGRPVNVPFSIPVNFVLE